MKRSLIDSWMSARDGQMHTSSARRHRDQQSDRDGTWCGVTTLTLSATLGPRTLATRGRGGDSLSITTDRLEAKPVSINRILVATDGSTTAEAALAWAADLAAPLGAEILVVSVIDLAKSYPGAGYIPLDESQMRERLDEELNGVWSERMRMANIAFHTLVREGHPASVIVSTAIDEQADLIVMGSRGHSGLTELLIGSVAHHVTHHARTPVVIVPPSAARAMEPVASAAATAS
jgi:universal stress protein A